jgi:hypothetical protein
MKNKHKKTIGWKVFSYSLLSLLFGGLSAGGAFLIAGNNKIPSQSTNISIRKEATSSTWTVSLGAPSFTGTDTYTLPNASITGSGTDIDKIRTMTIKVSSGSVGVTSSKLPSGVNVLTDLYKYHQTITLAFSANTTAADATSLLTSGTIYFDRLNQLASSSSDTPGSQSINVAISSGATTATTNISELVDSSNIHHY